MLTRLLANLWACRLQESILHLQMQQIVVCAKLITGKGQEAVNVTLSELIVWLIVGALAGSLAGMIVARKKKGFGHFTNLGIGLVGALIGGFIFDLFNIDLGLGDLMISFEDLLSAFIGSFIFLAGLWYLLKRRREKSTIKGHQPNPDIEKS